VDNQSSFAGAVERGQENVGGLWAIALPIRAPVIMAERQR